MPTLTFKVSPEEAGEIRDAARRALDDIRSRAGGFVESPPPILPPWASTAAKTSDAYLTQVAAAAGLHFATFDTGIPGATLIGDPLLDG